jgi:long-chain acyl-CoA synthetase
MATNSKLVLKDSCKHKAGLFGDVIYRNAWFFPERDAFILGDRRITFEQYNNRVNSLIHALRAMGLRKGDVVGVLSWNCLEYMDVYGACEKAGFILAPFSARLSTNDFSYMIKDSGASVLFVGSEFTEMISYMKADTKKLKGIISMERPFPGMISHEELINSNPTGEPDTNVDDKDKLFIWYTSGTTGRPKGALYTHERFHDEMMCLAREVPIDSHDICISLLALFHSGGIALNHSYVYQGATVVHMKTFDAAEMFRLIEKEKVTNLSLVPTHLSAMLDVPDRDKYNVSSVRRIYYAGSPMPEELLIRGIEKFGLVFYQAYGLTETGPDISCLKEKEHDVLDKSPRERQRLLSCGRPSLGVQVRIVDDNNQDVPVGELGEIIARSKHLAVEYWKKPEETKKSLIDGWFHTGDIGKYDEDGYIYIVDRKKDMIVSGGENIFPREVEEVLYCHPAVLECAVFGIPDPKWVETVHAVVSLKKGTSATPEELIKYCKENIARFKAPKSVEIVPELPKGATGKILKRDMKRKYWDNR